MYYELHSVESLVGSDLTRTIVLFWANRADYLRDRERTMFLFEEEFISDLRTSATRVVTNTDGWLKLTDGTYVDPETMVPEASYEFERETIELDPAEQLLNYIEAFIEAREADILSGRLGKSRVSRTIRVRPNDQGSAVARDSRIRAVVRSPRESRVREVRH